MACCGHAKTETENTAICLTQSSSGKDVNTGIQYEVDFIKAIQRVERYVPHQVKQQWQLLSVTICVS